MDWVATQVLLPVGPLIIASSTFTTPASPFLFATWNYLSQHDSIL